VPLHARGNPLGYADTPGGLADTGTEILYVLGLPRLVEEDLAAGLQSLASASPQNVFPQCSRFLRFMGHLLVKNVIVLDFALDESPPPKKSAAPCWPALAARSFREVATSGSWNSYRRGIMMMGGTDAYVPNTYRGE
jgi:hypothetical protein